MTHRSVVAASFALLSLLAASVRAEPAAATADPQPLPPGVVEIAVEDLHCKTCAKKAARKLYAIKGVQKVGWDIPADLLTARSSTKQPISPLAFWDATIAGGLKPATLRYADIRIDEEQIEQLRQQARVGASQTR